MKAIEYTIIGEEVEEHFGTFNEAVSYLSNFSKKQQVNMQLFSKEWIDGCEGDVVIFKNYGEHL